MAPQCFVPRRHRNNCDTKLSDQPDRVVDRVDSPVYVAEGTLLQALGKAVVFFMSDVLMSLLQELLGAVQASNMVQPSVNRRMVVQVFAVVDGRLLDFGNRVVDGMNGFFLLMA